MKKKLCILAASLLVLSITACNKESKDPASSPSSGSSPSSKVERTSMPGRPSGVGISSENTSPSSSDKEAAKIERAKKADVRTAEIVSLSLGAALADGEITGNEGPAVLQADQGAGKRLIEAHYLQEIPKFISIEGKDGKEPALIYQYNGSSGEIKVWASLDGTKVQTAENFILLYPTPNLKTLSAHSKKNPDLSSLALRFPLKEIVKELVESGFKNIATKDIKNGQEIAGILRVAITENVIKGKKGPKLLLPDRGLGKLLLKKKYLLELPKIKSIEQKGKKAPAFVYQYDASTGNVKVWVSLDGTKVPGKKKKNRNGYTNHIMVFPKSDLLNYFRLDSNSKNSKGGNPMLDRTIREAYDAAYSSVIAEAIKLGIEEKELTGSEGPAVLRADRGAGKILLESFFLSEIPPVESVSKTGENEPAYVYQYDASTGTIKIWISLDGTDRPGQRRKGSQSTTNHLMVYPKNELSRFSK